MEIENAQPPKEAGDGFEQIKRTKKNHWYKIFYIEEESETTSETPSKVLRNKYAVLENLAEPEKDNNNITFITKPKLPPPIVLRTKVKDHKKVVEYINKIIGKQYYLKDKQSHRTNLQ